MMAGALFTSPNALEEEQLCPRVTYDCGNKTIEGLTGSLVVCCILVTSSVLSCLGASLIIIAYCVLKDIRKGAQTIITLLAIADLVYSGSLIMAGINYFIYYKETVQENCEPFQTVCKIQALITLEGGWSTFVWTSVLAFYFFMFYTFPQSTLALKLMPLYHILSWGVPIVVGLVLLIVGKLGLYPGWLVCYTKPQGSAAERVLLLLLGGWLPELISCAFVIILYTVIGIHLCRQHHLGAATQHAEKRLLLIPAIYAILRIWNSAEYVYISNHSLSIDPCDVKDSLRTFFYVVTILQVVADSSQGWVNAILYVFLSRKMRDRLFWKPLEKVGKQLGTELQNRYPPPPRPTSEATPLYRQTETEPTNTRTQDTHYSFPTEFPSSCHPRATSVTEPESGVHPDCNTQA